MTCRFLLIFRTPKIQTNNFRDYKYISLNLHLFLFGCLYLLYHCWQNIAGRWEQGKVKIFQLTGWVGICISYFCLAFFLSFLDQTVWPFIFMLTSHDSSDSSSAAHNLPTLNVVSSQQWMPPCEENTLYTKYT